MENLDDKIVIGRLDKADFPILELQNIEVKIDTGAFTSAIHCHNVEEIERNGKQAIRFYLLDPTHPEYNNKELILYEPNIKKIKSSNGSSEERYAIETEIILFGQIYKTEFTLADRTEMKYPVLLGRKLLSDIFLVDVSKSYLSYELKTNSPNPV